MKKLIEHFIFILESLTSKRDKAVYFCIKNDIPLKESTLKEIMKNINKKNSHINIKHLKLNLRKQL